MRFKIPFRITNCNSRGRRTRGREAVGKIMTIGRLKFYFFLDAFETICEDTIANSK
jgi:hypothetical protein